MGFLEDIRRRARDRPRRIVFSEGADPRILEAVARIQAESLLEPIVIGEPEAVRSGLSSYGGDPDSVTLVDSRRLDGVSRYVDALVELRRAHGMTVSRAREEVRSPLVRGALMVRLREADGSVAGAAHSTPDVLRAAIRYIGPADGVRTVSSAFYMLVPPFRGADPEVLTFTDCAVVPEPTSGQLAQIGAEAAVARRRIVGDSPVVAFLSYSTKGSGEGTSPERVRNALALFRDLAPGVPADGELQGDAALIESVARPKAPYSAVAGSANVLVFPSLDAGNIAYKLVERLAGAEAIGPVLQGLRRPASDLSRAVTPAGIVSAACLTSLLAD